MQSIHTLSERIGWKVGSTRTPRVSYDDVLNASELLVGPPTIVELVTTDLTIDTKVVSSQSLTIDQETVATGRAVTFRVSGHIVANAPYTIRITVSTDGSPVQTFVKDMIVEVEA